MTVAGSTSKFVKRVRLGSSNVDRSIAFIVRKRETGFLFSYPASLTMATAPQRVPSFRNTKEKIEVREVLVATWSPSQWQERPNKSKVYQKPGKGQSEAGWSDHSRRHRVVSPPCCTGGSVLEGKPSSQGCDISFFLLLHVLLDFLFFLFN